MTRENSPIKHIIVGIPGGGCCPAPLFAEQTMVIFVFGNVVIA
jgi:hypothetical protein